jgi:clan AA aspartic protease
MGHVRVHATVSARRSETVDFLVDTGSTFSVIPPDLADRIGAVLLPKRFTVRLADGTRRRPRVCGVGIRVAGREGPTMALVLPGSDPVLGVETLEALGLAVNPRRRRLEPTRPHAALLYAVGWR